MIVLTNSQWEDLKAVCKTRPLEENELEDAQENAHDGGNFNDTLDRGFDLGYRTACDEVRAIFGWD
ncbi:hypothetical protein QCE62_00175 [Caballeronia sp. LZ033]|uniref:hypothetical protein n=1 Tax=Caballeronia sp. LZ033 TaxID=3038566 RepID=UPI00285D4BBB|nr:hypothetical protein [Caballeronia sp. LZ033]MDR5812003.1 hypothetical protein [Caballeronia sp. LZ033]